MYILSFASDHWVWSWPTEIYHVASFETGNKLTYLLSRLASSKIFYYATNSFPMQHNYEP